MTITSRVDKAQLPELGHEEMDARTGGADHLRHCLLADWRDGRLGLPRFPKVGQEQKSARQALFARIEKLIDQIFFDTDRALEKMGQEHL